MRAPGHTVHIEAAELDHANEASQVWLDVSPLDEAVLVRVELLFGPVVYVLLAQIMKLIEHARHILVLDRMRQDPDVEVVRVVRIFLDVAKLIETSIQLLVNRIGENLFFQRIVKIDDRLSHLIWNRFDSAAFNSERVLHVVKVFHFELGAFSDFVYRENLLVLFKRWLLRHLLEEFPDGTVRHFNTLEFACLITV